jgi:ABC-type molybdate transport system substrate-binding protein
MISEGWRVGRPGIAAMFALCVLLAHSAIASAERITVLCSNGFKAVLQEVAPQFEKATKHEVAEAFAAVDPPPQIRRERCR